MELDLYKFHEKPEQLHGHDFADETVPARVFEKVNNEVLRKRIKGPDIKISEYQEKALARSAFYSYKFALLSEKRFPAGEKAISRDPGLALQYAYRVIKKRWPEGEDAIIKNPMYAEQYARGVIKGRFPKGEKSIASDPDAAYDYAKMTIGKPWPPGEAAILTDPIMIKWYAKNILNDRWPEGEKVLKKKENWRDWDEYCDHFDIPRDER